jgi:hypothetical protein
LGANKGGKLVLEFGLRATKGAKAIFNFGLAWPAPEIRRLIFNFLSKLFQFQN